MDKTVIGKNVIFPALFFALATGADAQELPTTAPEGWECKLCPEPEKQLDGYAEAGAGYVSDDSEFYGSWSGLDNQGAYAVGAARLQYRGKEGAFADAYGDRLGIESRSLGAAGGKEGSYRLYLDYDEVPYSTNQKALTPYHGLGSDRLTLPDNWVPGPTTADFTALPDTQREVNIDTDRKTVTTGFSFWPQRDWKIGGEYRHYERQGKQAMGAAIGANYGAARAAILPAPVDEMDDQVDVSVSYLQKRWQAQVGYYGSFFDNRENKLVWQNAFADPSSPTGFGQLALSPDNQFNQVYGRVGYDLGEKTHASGYFAYGHMNQNQNLLPATINPLFSVPLPENSANAEATVTDVKLQLSSNPKPRLGLDAEYQYHDRSNDTDSEKFQYVIADAALAPVPADTLPYDFTQNLAKLSADYRFAASTRLAGGFTFDRHDRNYQARHRTNEWKGWTKLSLTPRDDLEAVIDLEYAERRGSDFHQVSQIVPPENPLMRDSYLADRDRQKAGLFVTYTPVEKATLGLGADYSDDDYNDSQIGLTRDREINYTADLSLRPHDHVLVHAFYTRTDIHSKQANSMAFAAPNWSAKNDDTVDTVGVGGKWTELMHNLDVGADYVYARSKLATNVDTSVVPEAPFPDITTRLHSVSLYADYAVRKDMSLRLRYAYENFDYNNWAYDDVAPNTIPQVLSLGQDSLDYGVHVVALSLRYKF
jgi:MtrB/PioB family decaheme-associated outer membrane protein